MYVYLIVSETDDVQKSNEKWTNTEHAILKDRHVLIIILHE